MNVKTIAANVIGIIVLLIENILIIIICSKIFPCHKSLLIATGMSIVAPVIYLLYIIFSSLKISKDYPLSVHSLLYLFFSSLISSSLIPFILFVFDKQDCKEISDTLQFLPVYHFVFQLVYFSSMSLGFILYPNPDPMEQQSNKDYTSLTDQSLDNQPLSAI